MLWCPPQGIMSRGTWYWSAPHGWYLFWSSSQDVSFLHHCGGCKNAQFISPTAGSTTDGCPQCWASNPSVWRPHITLAAPSQRVNATAILRHTLPDRGPLWWNPHQPGWIPLRTVLHLRLSYPTFHLFLSLSFTVSDLLCSLIALLASSGSLPFSLTGAPHLQKFCCISNSVLASAFWKVWTNTKWY